jgi:hypothetical protein
MLERGGKLLSPAYLLDEVSCYLLLTWWREEASNYLLLTNWRQKASYYILLT